MSDTTPPPEPEPTPPTTGYTAGATNPYQAGSASNPYQAGSTSNPYQPAGGPAEPKPLSIISMVTGIIGVISFGYFGLASIAALILGYMGKKREPSAKAFWLTGIITGWVGVALMIIVIGFWIVVTIAAVGSATYSG